MKKCCLLLVFALLLCGCASQETFEKVEDDPVQAVMQEQREISLTVDGDALALQGETGTMYLCDGYEVTVETLSAGNVSGTFQALTGFGTDGLTVIETAVSDVTRYECVWSAAGEAGDVVGRAVLLDDGIYHYCVTVLADADDAYTLQKTWEELLDSIVLT